MTISKILMIKFLLLFTKSVPGVIEGYYSIKTLKCLRSSTFVERTLQISPFLTNKPNSPIVHSGLTFFTTMAYMILTSLTKVKFKPNSNPNKANFNPIWAISKPIQSQFKANSNPIITNMANF